MNKSLLAGIASGLIIGLGAGYFIPHGASAQGKGQFGTQGSMFGGRAGARGIGAAAVGQILSVDSGSITIKMQDGSTKLVLMSTSTPILKTTQGGAADLRVGTDVVAAGSQNSDGSLTAQSIQIRPAGAVMFRAGTQGQ